MADRQDVVLGAWVVLGEAQDALRCGLAPTVDRLLVVPHGEDRDAALGEQLEDAEVAGVEVLVLVDDEEVVVEALEIIVGLKRLAEQVRKLAEERVAHDAPVLAERPDEAVAGRLVDLRILLGGQRHPHRRHLRQQPVLDESRLHARKRRELGPDDLVELPVVSDPQRLREWRRARVAEERADREGVHGARPLDLRFVRGHLAGELGGRCARERQQADPRPRIAPQQQMNEIDDRGRLAGAGPGQHPPVAIGLMLKDQVLFGGRLVRHRGPIIPKAARPASRADRRRCARRRLS